MTAIEEAETALGRYEAGRRGMDDFDALRSDLAAALRSLIEHSKEMGADNEATAANHRAYWQGRAVKAESERDALQARIDAVLRRHVEKHGESPRYAPDDWDHERKPVSWEPYVICAHEGTQWPCFTVRILKGENP